MVELRSVEQQGAAFDWSMRSGGAADGPRHAGGGVPICVELTTSTRGLPILIASLQCPELTVGLPQHRVSPSERLAGRPVHRRLVSCCSSAGIIGELPSDLQVRAGRLSRPQTARGPPHRPTPPLAAASSPSHLQQMAGISDLPDALLSKVIGKLWGTNWWV